MRCAAILVLASIAMSAEPLQLDLQRGHQVGFHLALQAPGTLLTADPGVLCAWDLASRSLRWQAPAGNGTLTPPGLPGAYALGADASTLACAVGYRIELRRLADGERIRNVNAFWIMGGDGSRPAPVEAVALTPDGRWIVACGPVVQPDYASAEDAWVQTVWYPVDPRAAKALEWEPGAVGTDPPDEMEAPARSQPGRLLGLDAAGRALVRNGGAVSAVPAPGAGGAVPAPAPAPGLAIGGGRLTMADARFAWSGPGGGAVDLAVVSRLPDLGVRAPESLDWCARDGLLVGVGADAEDPGQAREIGAVYRWRLPACTPLPVLTVPGTRRLRLAGDLLVASTDPAGASAADADQAGARVALLAWGPEATVAGPVQPFARQPDFPAVESVACDATSAWLRVGGRMRRFALADGSDLPAAGQPPPAPAGADFTDVADERTDATSSAPPEADAPLLQHLIAHAMHPHRAVEDRLGRPFAWAWLAGDGSYGWSASGPHLFLYRPVAGRDDDGRLTAASRDLVGHAGPVTAAALTPDRRLLVTAGADGICAVWRLPPGLWQPASAGDPELMYRRITTRTGGWLAMAPDGIYAGTRDAIDGVAARRGGTTFPVSQVELTHHRPDLLQARIGLSPPERIAALRRAWELRLRRMGLDPSQLAAEAPPVAGFAAMPPIMTGAASLQLGVTATDPAVPLARLLVTVDGTPLPDRSGLGRGRAGVTAGDGGRTLGATIDVPLVHGLNIIEVAAVNEHGIEGPARRVVVNRTGAAAPRLVVCAIGVSHYANPAFDLHHATSDAERAAQALAALPGFTGAEVRLVRDAEATRAGILALRERLAATAPDDLVVLFLAGHGVLDDRLDWWFLTHDGDPEHPAAGCVAYREIEGLLDAIPARRRLLLMDACHAGEVDASGAAPPPGVKVRDIRGLKRVAIAGSAEDAALMRDTFIDLRRAAGAVVIAASAGQEVAYEDERWQGGAFTRALLDALDDPAADADGDGALTAIEWRTAVAGRVRTLTGGLQQPVQRADNPLADIVLRRR